MRPCLRVTEDNMCVLKEVPFRGVNCSDAAGRQYCYPDIACDFFPLNTTPLLYDENSKSKYFNYKKDGIVHQVWYDDPESMKLKYLSAFEHFMRGIFGFGILIVVCYMNLMVKQCGRLCLS